MRKLMLMVCLAMPFAVACGDNVCDDAAVLCGAEGSEGDCTGAAEAQAQCLVDRGACGLDDIAACIDTGE